jgi:hypothetical protein
VCVGAIRLGADIQAKTLKQADPSYRGPIFRGPFASGRPLKAFVAFAVIAASLFDPLQTTVCPGCFVRAVLVQPSLHSCLACGLTRILGRNSAREYRVACCDRRRRRPGSGRFRRLCSRRRWRAPEGVGSEVASAPHCALRKSFHLMPPRVPASFAPFIFGTAPSSTAPQPNCHEHLWQRKAHQQIRQSDGGSWDEVPCVASFTLDQNHSTNSDVTSTVSEPQ